MVRIIYMLAAMCLPIVWGACNWSSSPDGEPSETCGNFTNPTDGRSWLYAAWEKRYDGERVFTGDTLSVTVIATEGEEVTFLEGSISEGALSMQDTTTFTFRREGSLYRQVGINLSRIFGIVGSHDGVLLLGPVDSNRVTIDINTSLFSLRRQTGKNRFVGHADVVELFSDTYKDVVVYYDETPTYVDGPGHLAIFSSREGMVVTIYFGGYSPIEQFGFKLVK